MSMVPTAGAQNSMFSGVGHRLNSNTPGNRTGGALLGNSDFGAAGRVYDPRNDKTGAPVDYVMQPEADEDEDLL